MPEFAWPWLLLLMLLPWALPRRRPALEDGRDALCVPWGEELAVVAAQSGAARARPGRVAVGTWLVWGLLCVALARPQWLDSVEMPPRTGRDLMLAVDLSGSMGETDMRLGRQPVDRLTAVKAVLGDFLDRRGGDRVGLILFGQRAFAVTPLTFDLETVRQQLFDSVVGLAGRETAIGDALALAVKRLHAQRDAGRVGDTRVVILLTDGVNNAGVVDPEKAAELAAIEGIRVHTVGFGGERPTGVFGLPLRPAEAEIDEVSLRAIAERTGGRYFRARDTAELAGIYAELERLEPAAYEGEPLRPRRELYPWPLAAALLLGLVMVGLERRRAWT